MIDNDCEEIDFNNDDFCPDCSHSVMCKYQKERLSDVKEKLNKLINDDIHPYKIVEISIACMYYENKNNIN